MLSEASIRERLEQVLSGSLSLDDFEGWTMQRGLVDDGRKLRDINGNTVGAVRIEGKDER